MLAVMASYATAVAYDAMTVAYDAAGDMAVSRTRSHARDGH